MTTCIIPLIPICMFFSGTECASVHVCALNMDVSLVLFCLLDATEFSSKIGSNAHRLMWEMFCCFVALGRQLIC